MIPQAPQRTFNPDDEITVIDFPVPQEESQSQNTRHFKTLDLAIKAEPTTDENPNLENEDDQTIKEHQKPHIRVLKKIRNFFNLPE